MTAATLSGVIASRGTGSAETETSSKSEKEIVSPSLFRHFIIVSQTPFRFLRPFWRVVKILLLVLHLQGQYQEKVHQTAMG